MIANGKLVVDASVAVKWYVPEPGAERAAPLLASGNRLLAPELLIAELGNVLWRKVQRGELGVAQAELSADTFLSTPPVTFYPLSPLLRGALDVAMRYRLTGYDATYVSLAITENCQLVTGDARLVQLVQGTPLVGFVRQL